MNQKYIRIINAAFVAAFAVAVFLLLGITEANYLRKIDMLSLFVPTRDYLNDCLALPGGLLVWIATFLTQTFYHPSLGALVYILLLLPMAWLALGAGGLRRSMLPVVLLLPSAVLLALLRMGYVIFSLKSPGFAFALPLAIDICLGAFWGYRKIRPWAARLVILPVAAAIGYCLIGSYALLLTAMFVAYEIAYPIGKHRRALIRGLISAAVGIAAIVLVPRIWFAMIGGDLPMALIYRYPLPYFHADETAMWIPYIVIAMMMFAGSVAGARIHRVDPQAKTGTLATVVTAVIGAVAIAGVYVLRYTDRNFSLTLDLDNALQHEQWQQAYDIIFANQDIEPTRANAVLSAITLQRLDCAPQMLFKLRTGSAPYNTTRHLQAVHDIVSIPMAYHLGLSNYAYRWVMENEVEYGRSFERLRYQAKTALLNKDYAVARKCLDTLSKSLFHKQWTEKYYRYLEQPELIAQDPELGSIMPLICDEHKFIDDHGQLEGYVWPALASIEKGQFKALELSLTSALVCMRLDLFAEAAPVYARNVSRLPVHFQEAVLMWSYANDSEYYRAFDIDQYVMHRFGLFTQMLDQASTLPPDVYDERMHEMFGDTYWYYCMFANDVKVI